MLRSDGEQCGRDIAGQLFPWRRFDIEQKWRGTKGLTIRLGQVLGQLGYQFWCKVRTDYSGGRRLGQRKHYLELPDRLEGDVRPSAIKPIGSTNHGRPGDRRVSLSCVVDMSVRLRLLSAARE